MYSVLLPISVSSVSDAPAALRNRAPLLSRKLRPLLLPMTLSPELFAWMRRVAFSVTELLPVCVKTPFTVSVPASPGVLTIVPPVHCRSPSTVVAAPAAILSVPPLSSSWAAIELPSSSVWVPPDIRTRPSPSKDDAPASVLLPPRRCSVAPAAICCVPSKLLTLSEISVPASIRSKPACCTIRLPL